MGDYSGKGGAVSWTFSLTFVGQQRRFAREDNVREYNLGENWPCGKRRNPWFSMFDR